MSVLLSFAPVALPRINEISLDGHALLFSCALTMITGVVFGLVPALQASKVDLTTALKDGSRSSGGSRQGSRLRNCLVITEISLALILLVGAGLLARTFSNIQQAELGYDPNVVHVTRVTPRAPLYPDNQARIDFVDRSLAQLNTKPELVASAFTTGFPLFGARGYRLDIETRSDSDLDNLSWVALSSITPDYFKVMSNTLIRGRWFNERDREDTPLVAIISERVAEQHFPEQNPIGQRIAFTRDDTREWREIVGVVADIRMGGYIRDWSPGVYVPFAQHTTGWRFMPVVRVRPGAPNPGPVVASAIHAVDPNMPIPRDIVCIAEYVANSVATQRFSLFLFGVFSGAALLLAAIGIYGVMAYNVSQRTNELGLRMALGAQKRNIIALVLARAAKLIVIGVVIGVAGALAGSHLLESVLYEISAYDPVTFVGIAVILTAVALLACLLPARRATKVDPMVALRTE
jgi:putative ABC transport system permease protein